MNAFVARAQRWWFAPDARHQPGIWRILIAGWVGQRLWLEVLPRLPDYATRPRELADPVTIARVLSLPIPEASSVGLIRIVTGVLAIATVLGVFTRVSTLAFALSASYLGLLANGWGYSAHASGLPFIALFVIAFAPGIDALSVDAWVAARRDRRRADRESARARFLGGASSVWPLRLMLVLVVLTYFAAGIAKLRHTGPEWTDGKTLAFYMSGGSLRDRTSPQRFISDPDADPKLRFRDGVGLVDWAWLADPTPLGKSLAGSAWLTRLLATLSLALELVFPLAFVSRRSTWALLGAAALFHVAIKLTMQISFLGYLVVYAMFVDWYAVFRFISGRLGISPFPTKKVLEPR